MKVNCIYFKGQMILNLSGSSLESSCDKMRRKEKESTRLVSGHPNLKVNATFFSNILDHYTLGVRRLSIGG